MNALYKYSSAFNRIVLLSEHCATELLIGPTVSDHCATELLSGPTTDQITEYKNAEGSNSILGNDTYPMKTHILVPDLRHEGRPSCGIIPLGCKCRCITTKGKI